MQYYEGGDLVRAVRLEKTLMGIKGGSGRERQEDEPTSCQGIKLFRGFKSALTARKRRGGRYCRRGKVRKKQLKGEGSCRSDVRRSFLATLGLGKRKKHKNNTRKT